MPETDTAPSDASPEKSGPNPLGVFILVLAAIFVAAWAIPVIGAFFWIVFGGIFAIFGAIFGLILAIFAFVAALIGTLISLIIGLLSFGLLFLPMAAAGVLAVVLAVVIVKALRSGSD